MVRGGDEMNKNQKPSMSKRRATVAAVLCFVAVFLLDVIAVLFFNE